MNQKYLWIGLMVGLLPWMAQAAEENNKLRSSVADRNAVSVTVYNEDLALVRDLRQLKLPVGEIELRFEEVAERIRPETVSLRSLARPASLHIHEQNYEYDLISPQQLMEKYVGRDIRLRSRQGAHAFQEVDATLLGLHGGPIYQLDEDIYLGHPGSVVLPELPDHLTARPSLNWLLENKEPEQEIEVTYLTRGLNWEVDYVLRLPREGDAISLTGWITLDNRSGISYPQAELKLVAGDVNIIREAPMFGGGGLGGLGGVIVGSELAMKALPEQEAFGDFHLYTVPRRTTIAQNQRKQIMLLHASDIKFTQRYEYRHHTEMEPYRPQQRESIAMYWVFENEEANQLGIPLPAGAMRLYQEDADGYIQFSGETRIEHTPKNETIEIAAQARELWLEYDWVMYEITSGQVQEWEVEVPIHNNSNKAVTVDFYETFHTQWEILESTHSFEQEDAFTAVFPVTVPADSTETLRFRVRVTFQ